MKKSVKRKPETIMILLLIYFILSGGFFLVGLSESSKFDKFYGSGCFGPANRLVKLFASYKLGCWLGEPLKESTLSKEEK